jgi:hypothetical protein
VRLAVRASHGLLYHNFRVGAFDRECFGIFVDALAEEVASQQIASPCFILDNCPIHNIEDVTETCEMFGGDFNFLLPYSPMLNPVEGCIGNVKPAMQTAFATILRATLLNLATVPYGQRTRERERLLVQAFTIALQVITPQ